MITVIHRIERGAFSGKVERFDDGDWSGWYRYSWSLAGRHFSIAPASREVAIHELHAAYRDYIWRATKADEANRGPFRANLCGDKPQS